MLCSFSTGACVEWDWAAELQEAKAIRAGYEGDVAGQVEHYIECCKHAKKPGCASYERINEALGPLLLELAPHQAMHEPPYYLEVSLDLWPSVWFLAEQLGLPPGELQALAWEGKDSPLSFKFQVEMWSGTRCNQQQAMQEGAPEGCQARLDVIRIAFEVEHQGDVKWRLDLEPLNCQGAILKALQLQLSERLTIYKPHLVPLPPCLAAAVRARGGGCLEIQDLNVHLRTEDSAVFQNLEALHHQSPPLDSRAQPYHSYMKRLRGCTEGKDELKKLQDASKQLHTGLYFQKGSCGVLPPSRAESLTLRAALDRLGSHALQEGNCEASADLYSEYVEEESLPFPGTEIEHLHLLHNACSQLFINC